MRGALGGGPAVPACRWVRSVLEDRGKRRPTNVRRDGDITMTEFFPNTQPPKPVPVVLTEDEAISFLRLDAGGRALEAARRALRRLVERKLIRPCRVGKRSRYLREELLRYLRWQTDLHGKAPDAPEMGIARGF